MWSTEDTRLSQKKASSPLRKEKRARVSSFFSLPLSLFTLLLLLSLSLSRFIYVCNQNCPVFALPSLISSILISLLWLLLLYNRSLSLSLCLLIDI